MAQVRRYWETEEEDEFKVQDTCLTCGEKDHEKRNCPHTLCLACGAFDDHSTRQCRQGINCHRCGGRGHTTGDCKQPRQGGARGYARECILCGSGSHMDSSCPTLFRVYYYNAEPEYRARRKELWEAHAPHETAAARRPVVLDYHSASDSSSSGSSSGDEEDSASSKESRSARKETKGKSNAASTHSPPSDWDPANVWCYNCASHEHWGDDCRVPRCNPTRMTGEPSVYSDVLGNSGPFARLLVQAQRDAGPPKRNREQDYDEDRAGQKRSHFEDRGGAMSTHFDPLPALRHTDDRSHGHTKSRKSRGRKDAAVERPNAKPYYGGALARKNRWKRENGEGGEGIKPSSSKAHKKKKARPS